MTPSAESHHSSSSGRWTYNGTFNLWWGPNTTVDYYSAVDCMKGFYANQTLGPYTVNGVNKTVRWTSDATILIFADFAGPIL